MPSKIEWTDETWNPIAGCTKCSQGCLNCYAERMARRLRAICKSRMDGRNQQYLGKIDDNGKWTGQVECCDWLLDIPLYWRKPRRIFICSMSDLFHPKVPFEFIEKVLRIIEQCPQHTFLILTKRPEVAFDFYGGKSGAGLSAPPLPNVHFGVSISNPDELWKVDELKKIPAVVRWLSIEPMLAGIEFTYDRLFCDRDPEEGSPVACVPCRCGKHWENGFISGTTLNCIDWVVCGGESGPGARPMHPDWPRGLRDQCVAAGVPYYFKQWGEYLHVSQGANADGPINAGGDSKKGYRWPDRTWSIRVTKKKAGCLLDGKEWKQYPK